MSSIYCKQCETYISKGRYDSHIKGNFHNSNNKDIKIIKKSVFKLFEENDDEGDIDIYFN